MNLRTFMRFIEMFVVVFLCASIIYIYFHFMYSFPYVKIIGVFLAWIIYKLVKFISIRNKKLYIKNY